MIGGKNTGVSPRTRPGTVRPWTRTRQGLDLYVFVRDADKHKGINVCLEIR